MRWALSLWAARSSSGSGRDAPDPGLLRFRVLRPEGAGQRRRVHRARLYRSGRALCGICTPEGAIPGITRGTTQNHIIRAAEESIAHQSADLMWAMEKDTDITISAP